VVARTRRQGARREGFENTQLTGLDEIAESNVLLLFAFYTSPRGVLRTHRIPVGKLRSAASNGATLCIYHQGKCTVI